MQCSTHKTNIPLFEYENRLVAFLDILGFKEAIKESSISQNKLLEIYYFLKMYSGTKHTDEVFSGFSNGCGFPCDDDEIQELRRIYPYSFTQFSDSFVFSVNSEDKPASQFFPLLIAQFIKRAFDLGFLVRGGISIGEMVHEENGPAFGPAFIEAYHLESRQAVFGRTVVSNNAFSFIKNNGIYCADCIDDGYDGVKEITISSFINDLHRNNKSDRVLEINKAIARLNELKDKIPEKDKEICYPKYNYIHAKLLDAIDFNRKQT